MPLSVKKGNAPHLAVRTATKNPVETMDAVAFAESAQATKVVQKTAFAPVCLIARTRFVETMGVVDSAENASKTRIALTQVFVFVLLIAQTRSVETMGVMVYVVNALKVKSVPTMASVFAPRRVKKKPAETMDAAESADNALKRKNVPQRVFACASPNAKRRPVAPTAVVGPAAPVKTTRSVLKECVFAIHNAKGKTAVMMDVVDLAESVKAMEFVPKTSRAHANRIVMGNNVARMDAAGSAESAPQECPANSMEFVREPSPC